MPVGTLICEKLASAPIGAKCRMLRGFGNLEKRCFEKEKICFGIFTVTVKALVRSITPSPVKNLYFQVEIGFFKAKIDYFKCISRPKCMDEMLVRF